MSVKVDKLEERVKTQVKKYQNELAKEQAAKEKEKKGKGWFGWGKKSSEET